MKVKIIETTHELDLQDDINEFLKNNYHIYDMKYQVAMCFSNELEYSFSCLILYDENV
ncbi:MULTISPECIES: sporulation protein Cse60 [Coprobacillaceae]|uniref:sporulation protein Cse60 n=1 Tax=Coprobacillaceae TaxID=2810280 RepID=UPI000E49449A|nr:MULTISPECIES: sporulation protein Cse60 [Coprobacillaceae]RHM63717.1 sporulation protein Cse60 [Coprobacillus sp. AF33-1AC]RHS96446.1 sporulation protein Cse60 [Erysipelatoclostridium sp. AM42-17]